MRILFITKTRQNYGCSGGYGDYGGYGLYLSAQGVVHMLGESGIDAHIVQVIDNNDIDREVSIFHPSIVVIEALWVIPEKFAILKKLHPGVLWIVRIHSNAPFLAGEGIATSWLREYRERGVIVAGNSKQNANEFSLLYLPNFYQSQKLTWTPKNDGYLDVACYGAIRSLKNQLIQAAAAARFAESRGKCLRFHVNGSRVENGGGAVLANLRGFFSSPHRLIEDKWMTHADLLAKLSTMDIGMQVSLSETFSIVSADMASAGLPMVVSPEVRWASCLSQVNPTEIRDIVKGLRRVTVLSRVGVAVNRRALRNCNDDARRTWLTFLEARVAISLR